MIQLHKLNGEKIWINPEKVLWIEAKPDTMLTFTDNKTVFIQESPQAIAQLFLNYRQQIGSTTACSTQPPSLEF